MNTPRSRTEQRDELIFRLGLLIDPIRRMIYDQPHAPTKLPFLRAQFDQDLKDFCAIAYKYCIIGQHELGRESDRIRGQAKEFRQIIEECRTAHGHEHAKTRFGGFVDAVVACIREVPCEQVGAIMPAQSPFKTYGLLRAIFAGAGTRIDLFDPYLGPVVFYRYLAEVPANVVITVVTEFGGWQPGTGTPPHRVLALKAVVDLFQKERPTTFRLCVSPSLHDRHLRADGEVLHLGGSLKDAGVSDPYTISMLSLKSHADLDAMMAVAQEIAGPSIAFTL